MQLFLNLPDDGFSLKCLDFGNDVHEEKGKFPCVGDIRDVSSDEKGDKQVNDGIDLVIRKEKRRLVGKYIKE